MAAILDKTRALAHYAAMAAEARLDDARPTRTPFAPPDAMVDAEDELLEDVDGFADWLGGECARSDQVRTGYVPLKPAALAEMTARSTTPELVALLLYPDRVAAGYAAAQLRERYLAASSKHIERIAARIAGEREALHGEEA
jgi:hypothetical protein